MDLVPTNQIAHLFLTEADFCKLGGWSRVKTVKTSRNPYLSRLRTQKMRNKKGQYKKDPNLWAVLTPLFHFT